MKRLLSNRENAEVIVVESNVTVRFMIVDVLRGMGFHNILPVNDGREALHQLKANEIDWLISPLMMDDEFNVLRLLKHIIREPGLIRTNVSLLLGGQDEMYCLGGAFELGLMSYHLRSYVRDELQTELQRLLDLFAANQGQVALTAAEYLRTYLRGQNQHGPRLTMERNLLPLFPGNARLLANLAEAEGLMGRVELAQSLKRQAELINAAPFEEDLQERLRAVCEADAAPESPQNILNLNSVVVIDPDPTVQNFASSILGELGVTCVDFFGQAPAIKDWLETKPKPDLVIMEWRVPGISGALLLQKIREKISHEVPIILMSSLIRVTDYPLLRELGVDRILSKPCDKESLQKALIWAIQQYRAPTEQKTMAQKIHALLKGAKIPEAEKLITKFMADPRFSNVAKQTVEADYEYSRRNFEASIRLCAEAIKDGGDSLFLMNLIGKSMLKLDMFVSAVQCFEKAHAMAPMNIERLLNIADAHLGLGQEEGAKNAVESILAVDPEHSAAAELECKIALNKGDKKAASEALKGVKSLPRIAAYINNRAISLAVAGRFGEGIDLYRSAIDVLPKDWSDIRSTVIYNLAMAYARNEDYPRALKALKGLLSKSNLAIHKKAKALAQHIKNCQTKGGKLFNPDDLRKNGDAHRQRWKEIAASIEVQRGEIGCYLLYRNEGQPDERVLRLVG